MNKGSALLPQALPWTSACLQVLPPCNFPAAAPHLVGDQQPALRQVSEAVVRTYLVHVGAEQDLHEAA